MLRNYFKIAIRNLQRNTIYSFINIAGLSVGSACSILIMLWVWDEVTYDRFHKNADQLGQLWVHNEFSDNITSSQAVPYPAYEFFKTYDNRIINTCLAYWPSNILLAAGDNRITKRGQVVTPEFLSMFQFPFVNGSAATALNDASSIVITESLATALFGDQDPINQTIRVANEYDLKVTGVLKDLPNNSSFDFEFLASWAIYAKQDWIKERNDMWDDQSFPVYIELQPGASLEEVNARIKNVIREKSKDTSADLFIHPLNDWRLRSTFENGKQTGGMIDYVIAFSLIAMFILIIACINFMNLATARSERRAREVGIRKSIGSRRRELMGQFLGESIMLSSIAFFMAVVLVEISLPLYNQLVDKELFIDYASPISWALSLGLILITGFFAGSYPAFYLSSFNPAKVLKGKLHAGRNATAPRKILVSLQFFFSIVLLAGMAGIYLQIQHVKARETGYDRANMITISSNEELSKNYTTFKESLLSLGNIQSVTHSSSPITEIFGNNTLGWPGKPADQEILFSRVITGYDYTKTMGIKMLQGRDFSEEFKSDTSAMLLNQAAVDAIGEKNPIGMQIELWSKKWTVVGVIDNVIMASPFREVQPGFFLLIEAWPDVITIRIASNTDVKESIGKIEEIFKKHNPSFPFEYQFVDEAFAKKFSSINLIGSLASVFALLAIFITGLGLLGLATFTAEQRTKEIGIRKVMGASNLNIIALISADFTRLVIIGFLFAAPLAWWGLNAYLDRYDYRVTISWWIIPLAGLVALLLTLLIVLIQTLKVTDINPSQSLRSE